jgi:hypothetical protein
MLKSITLMVALATLGCFSLATWAKPVTSAVPPKDAQCSQSVCTTKCDAKNEKCLVTCDDKAASNNCTKKFNHVTPYGVLEVTPKRGSPP